MVGARAIQKSIKAHCLLAQQSSGIAYELGESKWSCIPHYNHSTVLYYTVQTHPEFCRKFVDLMYILHISEVDNFT